MVERLNKIIRKKDLPNYVGLQRTQIELLIERGEFPRPVPLSDSGRAIGWLEHEVWAWQQARLAARDGSSSG
jgi:prophage regulatory protein